MIHGHGQSVSLMGQIYLKWMVVFYLIICVQGTENTTRKMLSAAPLGGMKTLLNSIKCLRPVRGTQKGANTSILELDQTSLGI